MPDLPLTTSAITTYSAALSWLFTQTRNGAPRSHGRMTRLMAQLGLVNPPEVIHVVGTNGKGSVSAAVAAGLSAAGRRAGRFISPHVVDFRERIAVDGSWISEEAVLEFVQRLPTLEPAPAFFELALALALQHFAREGVEVAVIEAGVGARHDATRALANVSGVVITTIGRDHLDTLGPTLRDVASDKADAIREHSWTVTGATGVGLEVIRDVAHQRRSPLHVREAGSPLFHLPRGSERTPTEQRNAQLAAASLRLCGVGEGAVAVGLEARLPARAERFWVAGKEVLLDGAHNPQAASALLEHTRPPFVLLFGTLPRKLGAETLAVLEPHAERVILTDASPGETNALQREGLPFIPEPLGALTKALSLCDEGGQLVIAGSFYLAGALRPFLLARPSARPLRPRTSP